MSHLHNNNAMNNSTSISNTQTSNTLLLTDFEPTNTSPLGSAIRHNSQAYRYMHSAHLPPMQSYHPAISLGGVGATAAAATAYYAFNGEPLDPLLIHPSMPIIPMMQMPSSSSSSRSRQVPQKSFSAPLSLYQFEQFLAQPPASAAPSPPASSSSAVATTTYCIPIAPLKSLDCFPDALRESPNPPTPTNLNEKNIGAATAVESSAFVVSTPASFIENNTPSTTATTAFIQQPHILSNSLFEISPIVCMPKKCSAKRSRITQTALLYLIDRYNENCTPSTAQLQVYAQHLNMDVPKLRICVQFLMPSKSLPTPITQPMFIPVSLDLDAHEKRTFSLPNPSSQQSYNTHYQPQHHQDPFAFAVLSQPAMSNLYHPAHQQQQQQSLDVSFPLHIQQDLFTSETFPNLGMSFNASFPSSDAFPNFLHSSIPQQQQQQQQQQYAIDSPSTTHESQFLDVSDLLAFQNSNNTITPTAPELFDLQNDLALFSTSPDLGLTLHQHHFQQQQQLLLSSPSQTPSHRLLGTSIINLATATANNSISPTDLYPEPSSMSQQQQQQQASGTTEFESSFELLAGPSSSSSSTTDTLKQPPLASSSSSRRPFTFPKCPPSSQPGSRPGSRAGSRASSPTSATTKEYKRVRVPRDQMEWLKQIYDVNPYPSQEELETISQDIGIGVRKVRVWFQNRRTRQKALMDRK
ncbi:hypothetical protein HDU77_006787 [Chytriomyces hyalinus]|nr:hypothetical protein HDU77_006787 [Chytriomyces hyalinus]